MKQIRPALVVLGVLAAALLALAACGGSEPTPTPEPTATPGPTATAFPVDASAEPGAIGSLVPELTNVSGWVNTEPFAISDLRGQVVLVDFWTYTCINCLRTLPYLRDWHAKYDDLGLEIVGVHTPEFEFEKVRDNVVAAVEKHGLGWRMAQDNDFGTWRTFNNRAWPSKFLIDQNGVIRYTHIGEGRYDETEAKIRELLEAGGVDVSAIVPGSDPEPLPIPEAFGNLNPEQGQTRELYAGAIRNHYSEFPYIFNEEYYALQLDQPAEFVDHGQRLNHFMVLHGEWVKGPESIRHARMTTSLEDYVALQFFGTSANVVIDHTGGDPFDVYVELDGLPIPAEAHGDDIMVDGMGGTYIRVDEPRVYRLILKDTYEGHELKLSSDSERFSVFAFTFGSYGNIA